MPELEAGDYRLALAPEQGGSVTSFDWRGQPLFRPANGPGILDTACFPLVPFSNRIARGQFRVGPHEVALPPNFPGSDHPHPLHGFGWLSAWSLVTLTATQAVLEHRYEDGPWPWPYRARQTLALEPDGLTIALSLTNLADEPMPAGLGLHPYFPCDADTRYLGLHTGEWRNDADCLPLKLQTSTEPRDWWDGEGIATRFVDTLYEGRSGPLTITWPSRRLRLTISPSSALNRTVVYTPADAGFFCIEPVSHRTNAHNEPDWLDTGLASLAPRETMAVKLRFEASLLAL